MSEWKPCPCPICGAKLQINNPEDWKPTFYDPDSGGDPYNAICDCGFSFCIGSYDYEEFVTALNRRTQPANEPKECPAMERVEGGIPYCSDRQTACDGCKPANEPLTLHFGRGELGVGTAYKVPDGPPREINIRRLDSPLPIASDTGDKGRYVDELENVLVRMRFENAESAQVLERAVLTVLAGFSEDTNEPLTLDELREMDGEPVWLNIADGKWGLVNSDDDEIELSRCGFIEFEKVIGLAYRRKPERSENGCTTN